ncbi:hypothetical protein GQ600_3737 [Phytophthora cactorum]|nr:hypothetical protein GQ600_3737 [Phytophthora cactorum]
MPGMVDLLALLVDKLSAFVTCFPRLLTARSFCKHMPLMKTSPLIKHVRLDTKRFGRVYLTYVTGTDRQSVPSPRKVTVAGQVESQWCSICARSIQLVGLGLETICLLKMSLWLLQRPGRMRIRMGLHARYLVVEPQARLRARTMHYY